jgi:hypothetical protein
MQSLTHRPSSPQRIVDSRESDFVKTPSSNHAVRAWSLLTAVALLALLQAGCACSGSLGFRGDRCEECFPVWPCYGVHSTCWRPWPAECPPCPSPFPPEIHAVETLPAAKQPLAPPTLEDQTLEPPAEIDPVPMTPPTAEPPAQPLTPPAPPEVSPSSFVAPVVDAPIVDAPPHFSRSGDGNLVGGELETESSSRRRKHENAAMPLDTSAALPLGSPAPTFQSTRSLGTLRWAPASSR